MSGARVAVGTVELHLPDVGSLKGKRHTLKGLKDRNIWVVGTDDQADKSMYQADLKGPLALVLGAEGPGLRRLTKDNCDVLVTIPMLGAVESLNVSVATGVVLYEAVRQRRI